MLPRRTEAGELEASATRRRTAAPGAPVVLVVEDDAHDCEQIESALTGAGYAVVTAMNGDQAIALCRERAFAAITLDLLLPDTNGWEVLTAIRTQGRNRTTPVIVVSVVAEKAGAATFAAQDYLIKPFHTADLINILQRHGVSPSAARSVMIVDDDQAAAAALRERLEQEGYRTLHAANAVEALTILKSSSPDSAVVDMQMSGGGYELLARLRLADSGRHMPVVFSTRNRLDSKDPETLNRQSLAVVAKGQNVGEAVVSELRAVLARTDAAPLKPAA